MTDQATELRNYVAEHGKADESINLEFDVKQALNMADGFILEWERQNNLPMTETRKAILQALSHFK